MSKLTLEDLRRLRKNENDRIRRANKRFQEATKAQKRVIVAKDVLTQLALQDHRVAGHVPQHRRQRRRQPLQQG